MNERTPFSEPTEPSEWIYTTAGRIPCEACGEWIYTRRPASGGSVAFPPECQVCGVSVPEEVCGVSAAPKDGQ